MMNILTGGFLRGWRTKILAGLLGINWIVSYAVGDTGLWQFIQNDWQQLAIALGLIAASVHEK